MFFEPNNMYKKYLVWKGARNYSKLRPRLQKEGETKEKFSEIVQDTMSAYQLHIKTLT